MRLLALVLAGLLLSSCGFTLCTDCGQVRPELRPLHFSSADPHAPLARRLADLLRSGGAELIARGDAAASLHLGEEAIGNNLLSTDGRGNPLEYEIILSASYRLRLAGAEAAALAERLTARRVYRFESANVLAAERERELLLDDMRGELAHAILRRINSGSEQPPADAPE